MTTFTVLATLALLGLYTLASRPKTQLKPIPVRRSRYDERTNRY